MPVGLFLFLSTSAYAQLINPAGPVAQNQLDHLWKVVLLCSIVLLPVFIGVPWIFWKYRFQNNQSKYSPDWEYSKPLELLMWGMPVVIVMILSLWMWKVVFLYSPEKPLGKNPMQVQVIGLDWKWLFIYPDIQKATIGELVLPVNTPIEFMLTTDTVMQSFMIPSLVGQIYVMPGMMTKLNLLADKEGVYRGLNTQFNGNHFSDQYFQAKFISKEKWEQWAKATQTTAVLDKKLYRLISKRGTKSDLRKDLNLVNEKSLIFQTSKELTFKVVKKSYHHGEAIDIKDQPGTEAFTKRVQNE